VTFVLLIDMFTQSLPFDTGQGRVSFCDIIVHAGCVFTFIPSYGSKRLMPPAPLNLTVHFMVILKKYVSGSRTRKATSIHFSSVVPVLLRFVLMLSSRFLYDFPRVHFFRGFPTQILFMSCLFTSVLRV
jgi:hypothetical protein